MKKACIFGIVGIILILISIILFFTGKTEIVNPNCVPICEFTKYTDVFSVLNMKCPEICVMNTDGKNYYSHNPIFILFFWLGVLSLLIRLALFIIEKLKNGQSKHF